MDCKTATRAAERIRDYWAKQGVDVTVTVVSNPIPRDQKPRSTRGKHVWGVRTDLKNGLPRPPQPQRRLVGAPLTSHQKANAP